jgi:hypothetical protein
MKTILSHSIITIVAFATISIVSCTKESDSPNSAVDTPVDQLTSEPGTINDHGLVNSDTRLMKTSFSIQSFIPTGYYGEEIKVVKHVDISFYVNEDGFIPSGIYYFEKSDSKSSFTFDSVVIRGDMTPADEIVNGAISVLHENGTYSIGLNCNRSSGETVNASYNGKMSYADVAL